MSAKFDNDKSPFFVDKTDQNFFLFQSLLGCIHSWCSPRFNWTSSWLDWKTLFVKLLTENFIGANFDNDISTFFVDYTDQKFLSLQSLLGCKISYSRPHSIWWSPWLDWKTLLVKLHNDTFLSAKFDNDMSSFFVDNPKKHFLFQNLLGCIHSYSSPRFIWTSSRLDWKTLFVKLHTESFMSAKFDNDKSPFFVDKTDQNFFLFQSLLGCIHSWCSPRFNWTSSWLDWKTLFVKLLTENFIGANFDNDISTLFVDYTDQKFLLLQSLLGCKISYSRPHSIWWSPWLDW